jgi:hypothetical protein
MYWWYVTCGDGVTFFYSTLADVLKQVFNNVSRSAWSTDESMQVPCIISEEMKTVQMALDVLSIYWQPLRKLVRSASHRTTVPCMMI